MAPFALRDHSHSVWPQTRETPENRPKIVSFDQIDEDEWSNTDIPEELKNTPKIPENRVFFQLLKDIPYDQPRPFQTRIISRTPIRRRSPKSRTARASCKLARCTSAKRRQSPLFIGGFNGIPIASFKNRHHRRAHTHLLSLPIGGFKGILPIRRIQHHHKSANFEKFVVCIAWFKRKSVRWWHKLRMQLPHDWLFSNLNTTRTNHLFP